MEVQNTVKEVDLTCAHTADIVQCTHFKQGERLEFLRLFLEEVHTMHIS